MLRHFFAIALAAVASGASSQDAKVKPVFQYGHDLRVRGVDEKNFSKDTQKVGVEFFKDTVTNALLAISEEGYLAVTPFATEPKNKKADWVAAFELRVRPASVENFKDSRKVAAETFEDLGSGKLFIVTAQKAIAFADTPKPLKNDKDFKPSDKEPAWQHGLVLKVRASGQSDFTDAKQIGVEAFKDGTTGGLIYLSEMGFIATAPAPPKAPEPDAVKPPKALHGLSLQARKWDEGDFTKTTQSYGVEVFNDPNSGATIYVSDTGSLATASIGEVKKGQGVHWSHSFVLKARPGNVKDFDDKAVKKFGVEVFEDRNTSTWIYICQNGSIAVLKK